MKILTTETISLLPLPLLQSRFLCLMMSGPGVKVDDDASCHNHLILSCSFSFSLLLYPFISSFFSHLLVSLLLTDIQIYKYQGSRIHTHWKTQNTPNCNAFFLMWILFFFEKERREEKRIFCSLWSHVQRTDIHIYMNPYPYTSSSSWLQQQHQWQQSFMVERKSDVNMNRIQVNWIVSWYIR